MKLSLKDVLHELRRRDVRFGTGELDPKLKRDIIFKASELLIALRDLRKRTEPRELDKLTANLPFQYRGGYSLYFNDMVEKLENHIKKRIAALKDLD